MRKFLPFALVIIIIAVIVGVALGHKNNNKNSNTTPPSNSSSSNMGNMNASSNATPPSSTSPTATDKVSIENFSFSPADITVKKGTTVTWTNNDSTAHTVTADSGNTFDSGTLEHGKTFSFTFNNAGAFAYHCNFHSDMHGKVTVTE